MTTHTEIAWRLELPVDLQDRPLPPEFWESVAESRAQRLKRRERRRARRRALALIVPALVALGLGAYSFTTDNLWVTLWSTVAVMLLAAALLIMYPGGRR